MLDTQKNMEQTRKDWEELFEKYGVTEETAMSPEYDYMDDDITRKT